MNDLPDKEQLSISIPCIFCGGQVRAYPREGENEQERRNRARRLFVAHRKLCHPAKKETP